MAIQHSASTAPTTASLAHSLRHLREVFTRPDLQAMARQHARGKLTVQEKIACLFDAGTFVEDMPPSQAMMTSRCRPWALQPRPDCRSVQRTLSSQLRLRLPRYH